MMKLRTEIEPLAMQGLIGHDSRIVTIGSCFADEIGSRLADRMFDVAVNPMGILFNPASIALAITQALDGIEFSEKDLTMLPEGDRYVTFHRHSRFSAADPEALVAMLNDNVRTTGRLLRSATLLTLTLGSSRCFVRHDNGLIVANCHRHKSDEFAIVDLDENQIVAMLSPVLSRLKAENPGLTIVLTVSPVRHASYGLAADSLSKARLRVAVDRLTQIHGDTIYFPAYEAVVDDLRDYRFFAQDLVHPTPLAADYVMDLLIESFVDRSLASRLNAWRNLLRALAQLDSTEAIARARALAPTEATLQRFISILSDSKKEKCTR